MAKGKPMYFLGLEIENVRCFGSRQYLDLSDGNGNPAQWTVILGENGVGKTTLLHSLTWMRPAVSPDADDARPGADGTAATERARRKDAGEDGEAIKPVLDDQDERIHDWFFGSTGNARISLGAIYQVGKKLNSDTGLKTEVLKFENQIERENNKLKEITLNVGWLEEFCEPEIFAYSAGRHMTVRNIDRMELKDPLFNLMSESGELYDAEQVLNDLNYKALIQKSNHPSGPSRASKLLERIKQMLADLLPSIESPGAIRIYGPKSLLATTDLSGLHLELQGGRISVDNLSLGYKTMLAWAVDLALRLYDSYPKSENPLDEPAIVLVDEIDLHLHPRWQRDIRTLLTKHFPHTQFILTAHSPLMAQAAENDNLAVVKWMGAEVRITNIRDKIKGLRIDQILVSDLFDLSSSRSMEIESLTDERRALIKKKKRSKSESVRLAELDKLLGSLPTEESPENQEHLDLIREAAEQIKKLSSQ